LDIDIINMLFKYSDTNTVSNIKYPDSNTDELKLLGFGLEPQLPPSPVAILVSLSLAFEIQCRAGAAPKQQPSFVRLPAQEPPRN
jgi:hypothetical protein